LRVSLTILVSRLDRRSRQARELAMWQHAAEHLEHMLSRQQGIDYSLESSSNAGGRHFRLWNEMPGS
jgi:hypothetical protein